MVVCNLGTASGFSNREVFEAAEAAVGTDNCARVGSAPRRRRPAGARGGQRKARELLGWQPRHGSLEEILGSAWRWRQAHPNGYPDGAAEVVESMPMGAETARDDIPADPRAWRPQTAYQRSFPARHRRSDPGTSVERHACARLLRRCPRRAEWGPLDVLSSRPGRGGLAAAHAFECCVAQWPPRMRHRRGHHQPVDRRRRGRGAVFVLADALARLFTRARPTSMRRAQVRRRAAREPGFVALDLLSVDGQHCWTCPCSNASACSTAPCGRASSYAHTMGRPPMRAGSHMARGRLSCDGVEGCQQPLRSGQEELRVDDRRADALAAGSSGVADTSGGGRNWPLLVRRAHAADTQAVLAFASHTWDRWDYIPNAWPVWLTPTMACCWSRQRASQPTAPPHDKEGQAR